MPATFLISDSSQAVGLIDLKTAGTYAILAHAAFTDAATTTIIGDIGAILRRLMVRLWQIFTMPMMQ
jgi:hypothetical protein